MDGMDRAAMKRCACILAFSATGLTERCFCVKPLFSFKVSTRTFIIVLTLFRFSTRTWPALLTAFFFLFLPTILCIDGIRASGVKVHT